jgi:hypothetical protein
VAGNRKFAVCRLFPANRPPIAGPSVKPIPIAAPMRPNEAARFSGTLTSDAYANAAEIFPAMNPPSIRDTSNPPMPEDNPRMR